MVASLKAHRLRQDEFRRKFGPDYRVDLDLIFANPDASPLMPNSISSTVPRQCRRLGLPKSASLHVLRHSHASLLLADGMVLSYCQADRRLEAIASNNGVSMTSDNRSVIG